MKYKYILTLFLFLFAGYHIYAQNIDDFKLTLPATKVQGSLYNKLTILDLRPDTTNLGFVQTGFFNRRATVIAKTPLQAQLKSVFDALITPAENQTELLLQLRLLSFAEITGAMTEHGYFKLRAALYATKGGQYQQIKAVDTLLVISSGIDVTQELLKTGKDSLVNFLANNLSLSPKGPALSLHDLMNIDSVEKSKTKLYRATTYAEGMYLTYKSFANQMPDKQITVEYDDVNLGDIKTIGENGKSQKVKAKKVYAIVYHGQPYISSLGTYYPLTKDKGEFTFTGDVRVAPGTAAIAAGVMFGALGALVANSSAQATFEIRLDYLTGDFIRIKEIPFVPQPEYHE